MTRSARRPIIIVRAPLAPRKDIPAEHISRCGTCRRLRLARFAKRIAKAELTRARQRHRGR